MLFINAEILSEAPDYEKAFYLFHELRHASQYLCPEQFGEEIIKSLPYTIMYDGTCYKLIDGEYLECKLDGGEDIFTDLYLGQPYEVDANISAYEQVKKIYGDSDELPKGVSECVDFLLWDPYKERYNDRCCFIRLQVDGEMHAGCIGLTEEQFMDSTETIRRIEAGDKNLWTSASKGSKVYQLDCASSYLKVLYVASFLVAFLL